MEDHAPLLELAREFLTGLGYQLLPTNLPLKALELSSRYTHKIDLLLTDVLIPGMNGHELAQQLKTQRPDMRVLYVSGFADRAFEEGGPSGPEAFMEKPYEFDELARKIREIPLALDLSLLSRLLQLIHINLVRLQHRLHRALCFLRAFVLQHLAQNGPQFARKRQTCLEASRTGLFVRLSIAFLTLLSS